MIRFQFLSGFIAAIMVLSFILPNRLHSQEVEQDQTIAQACQSLVDERAVPGVIAAIANHGQPIRIGCAGVRKAGDETSFTINDLVHLGSCTKAITATMIARLVQSGELTWDTTIAEGLPILKKKIHSGYHDVTIEQLLKHTAGVPANGPWHLKTGTNVRKRREAIITKSLNAKPKTQPGEKYLYSNLGYMIAGVIAAKKRQTTWEELVAKEVFIPLKMTTAGFGPPGTKGEVDQPWGHHQRQDQRFWPIQGDNPPPLGPAGTIHMSLSDWAKFALAHTAKSDSDFLTLKSLAKLHRPDAESKYSLGWIVVERPWGKGAVITHSGSNTMWFATVWVAPETQTAYFAATNVAGKKTSSQIDQLIGKLVTMKP